jgi:hypothetical protein
MSQLNLSDASELHIANQGALAVRIANVDIWTKSEVAYVERTVFGASAPPSDFVEEYYIQTSLGAGGWTGNASYTYSEFYSDWKVAGVRLWVPTGASIIGQSIKIGIYQTPEHGTLTWEGHAIYDIVQDMSTNSFMRQFPSGTVQAGWNNLYFAQPIPMYAYTCIALGVSIGDGSYAVIGDSGTWGSFHYASPDVQLALSQNSSPEGHELHRGFFKYGNGVTQWEHFHFGLDIIALQPEIDTNAHSIWKNVAPGNDNYSIYNDLESANGWTTSHFYSTTTDEGWKLIGARIWNPNEAYIGKNAKCSYYIKTSGRITLTEDTPEEVIAAVAANPHLVHTTIKSFGWNEVRFDTPITIPSGAGIAIGWQLGDGSDYVSAQIDFNPIPASDGSPFSLAGSYSEDVERRGAYRDDGVYYWAYNNAHYGGDIVVSAPE